jgi:magnesium transporter
MLISCVVYEGGHRVRDIPVEAISDYLDRPNSFVWVALKDPDESELVAIQEEFGLHDLAIEDARHGHQRPKIEEYGSSLFVVLHVIELVENELTQGEVMVFVGPQYAVSVRRNVYQGFAEVRGRTEAEPELLGRGPAYVLYALMDTVVDRYFPILDYLTDEIADVEERIFSGQTSRASVQALYGLKGKLFVVRHAASQMLEATGKLYGGRVPPVCAGLQEYFRDVYDHLSRLNQSIDSLQDMVTTAISVNLSLLTIQDGEVTKRLASYAALIAVPTLVVGIYGMNFKYMPETDWRYGYPVTLVVMATIDLYLYFRFKRANWL